jgi:hypothetical protein
MNEFRAKTLIRRGQPELAPFLDRLPGSWQAALDGSLPAPEAVEAIWTPVQTRARGFVVRLATITLDFGLFVPAEAAWPPALFYQTSAGESGSGWLGGLPAGPNYPSIAPAAYRLFTSVHNGFRSNGAPWIGALPLEELRLLPAERLLPFWRLPGGAMQSFDLTASSGQPERQGNALTLTLNPGSNAASQPQSFWSFLKLFTIQHLA